MEDRIRGGYSVGWDGGIPLFPPHSHADRRKPVYETKDLTVNGRVYLFRLVAFLLKVW